MAEAYYQTISTPSVRSRVILKVFKSRKLMELSCAKPRNGAESTASVAALLALKCKPRRRLGDLTSHSDTRSYEYNLRGPVPSISRMKITCLGNGGWHVDCTELGGRFGITTAGVARTALGRISE